MGGRNPLEENFGFGRINIKVNPGGPCAQPFIKCSEAVHIFIQFGSFAHIIPSALPLNTQINFLIVEEKEHRKKMDGTVPLRIAFVGPPVPRVEDQHVHLFPCIPCSDGVQFQYAPNRFPHYVY